MGFTVLLDLNYRSSSSWLWYGRTGDASLKFLDVFVKCQLDTDHHKNYETVNVTIDYKMFSTVIDLEDTVRLCFGHDLRRALEARPLFNAYIILHHHLPSCYIIILYHHLPSSTLFKYHSSMGTAILDSWDMLGWCHSRPCWLSSQPIHQRSRCGAPSSRFPVRPFRASISMLGCTWCRTARLFFWESRSVKPC